MTAQTETLDCDCPAEDALIGATIDPHPGTAGEKSGPIFGMVLLLGTLAAMGPLAIDMYLPGFPAMARELRVTESDLQGTLAAYFIGLAFGQLVYGPAADRWGRKRPLYFGLALFAIASLGCAMVHSLSALIALRMLQALGGCAEMVIARAIVRDKFQPRDAVRVFSGLVLVMGVAPILAPLAGGWLVGHHGWRSIFWALSAAAVAIFLVIAFFFRESLPPERRVKDSPGDIVRTYVSLLRDVPFMAFAVVTGLVSAALFVYVGGSPLVFMKIYGISEAHFGWFFGANAAGLIGMAQVNGALVHRGVSAAKLLKIALTVSTISASAMLAVALTGFGGFWALYVTIFCCLGCCGFIFPNATALAMAPHGKRAGGASAMLGFVQFLLSGVGGFAVSAIGATTARPMASLMFGFVVTALVVSLLAGRHAASIRVEGGPDLAH